MKRECCFCSKCFEAKKNCKTCSTQCSKAIINQRQRENHRKRNNNLCSSKNTNNKKNKKKIKKQPNQGGTVTVRDSEIATFTTTVEQSHTEKKSKSFEVEEMEREIVKNVDGSSTTRERSRTERITESEKIKRTQRMSQVMQLERLREATYDMHLKTPVTLAIWNKVCATDEKTTDPTLTHRNGFCKAYLYTVAEIMDMVTARQVKFAAVLPIMLVKILFSAKKPDMVPEHVRNDQYKLELQDMRFRDGSFGRFGMIARLKVEFPNMCDGAWKEGISLSANYLEEYVRNLVVKKKFSFVRLLVHIYIIPLSTCRKLSMA